jgi:hypothetical protein
MTLLVEQAPCIALLSSHLLQAHAASRCSNKHPAAKRLSALLLLLILLHLILAVMLLILVSPH